MRMSVTYLHRLLLHATPCACRSTVGGEYKLSVRRSIYEVSYAIDPNLACFMMPETLSFGPFILHDRIRLIRIEPRKIASFGQ